MQARSLPVDKSYSWVAKLGKSRRQNARKGFRAFCRGFSRANCSRDAIQIFSSVVTLAGQQVLGYQSYGRYLEQGFIFIGYRTLGMYKLEYHSPGACSVYALYARAYSVGLLNWFRFKIYRQAALQTDRQADRQKDGQGRRQAAI